MMRPLAPTLLIVFATLAAGAAVAQAIDYDPRRAPELRACDEHQHRGRIEQARGCYSQLVNSSNAITQAEAYWALGDLRRAMSQAAADAEWAASPPPASPSSAFACAPAPGSCGSGRRAGRPVRAVKADLVSVVAGVALTALGVLLLLDSTGTLTLRFDYAAPALLAVVGAVLLTAGLTRS